MVTKGQGKMGEGQAGSGAAEMATLGELAALRREGFAAEEKECLRCGWKWKARVERPKSCPACRSYLWEQAARGEG